MAIRAKEKEDFRFRNLALSGLLWKEVVNDKDYIIRFSDFDLDTSSVVELTDEELLSFMEDRKTLDVYLFKREKTIIGQCITQISNKIKWKVFRRDNFTCRYCGDNEREMTYDHFIPRSLGGQTTVENGRTSCVTCNQLKMDMAPEEWRKFCLKEYK